MTFDAYTRVLVCRRCCYTDPSVVQPLVGVIRSSAVYNQVLSADAVSKRYESSTVTIDVPIPCTRTSGAASSGNPSQSNVTCASASDTMVSCGIYGNDAPGGTYINPTTNQCTAFDVAPIDNQNATAQCCTFPSAATITTTTVSSSAGTSVSVQCPEGSEVTGCSPLHSSGDANLIQGAFVGIQSAPPQTAAWIDTDNTCNAIATSGATVQAVARCVTINNPSYTLHCQTKAVFTGINFGTCAPGYDMMACHAFAPEASLDAWYVTDSGNCTVQRDSYQTQYANAICCKLILTTFSPPTPQPTNNPSASPSANPSTSPSFNPSRSPSNNPSVSPSGNPSAPPTIPSANPSSTPTSHPSVTPSRDPSAYPSLSPTMATSNPTDNPSSSPTVTKHWVQIATENAGAGPTAIWRHLAFDFYSQYPAESIAAYRLEFNGDPGSYTNVLTFELDDKSLNLFNDSAASLADYHSINVLESSLAPIPVGNHYFCKQCATSRTDLVADTCWAVTPLSDPRRQSD
eukprot:818962_1